MGILVRTEFGIFSCWSVLAWLPVQDKYGMLEHWTRGRFPNVGERVAAWSGQVGCQCEACMFRCI